MGRPDGIPDRESNTQLQYCTGRKPLQLLAALLFSQIIRSGVGVFERPEDASEQARSELQTKAVGIDAGNNVGLKAVELGPIETVGGRSPDGQRRPADGRDGGEVARARGAESAAVAVVARA